MQLEELTIPRRFCGPTMSGNGGYVCGRVARHIEGPATVRLMSPPPIETPVAILSTSPERDDTILVKDPFRA